jgi:uncharacterized protein
MEPIKTSADHSTLKVTVRGRFDMSLVFDLWQTCQLEQDRYHTYIFDLGRVGELRDSGLAWLMMFHRRAARAGAGVRLINCRPEITERCVSAGLEIGSAVPTFFVHAAAAHTVYLAREPMRGCVHKTRLKELMDHYNTHAPLSKSELEALDAFLISGATSNACMNMEELDGFFAALICGPEMVMPSEYLPIVWGQENEEDGLVFESEAQAQQIFSLLMRHWNTIATTLDAGEPYEPLLYEYEVEGTRTAFGNDWAMGFMRGLLLHKEAWQTYLDDKEHTGTLMPIIALAKEHNPKMVEEKFTPEQRAKMLKVLPACILMIYRYWQSYRTGAKCSGSIS